MMFPVLSAPPLVLVCSDAALDDLFHFRNGYLVKTAWFHSLHTQNRSSGDT